MRSKTGSDYPSDPQVQFSKLMNALLTNSYTGYGIINPDGKNLERQEEIAMSNSPSPDSIAPQMFKKAISTNHPLFSLGGQQDSSEYLNHLLENIDRFELRAAAGNAIEVRTGSTLFDFNTEIKTICSITGAVKYSKLGPNNRHNILELRVNIPLFLNFPRKNKTIFIC